METNGKTKRVSIVTRIMEANDRVAEENRRRLAASGTCMIDIIGSPGAGKTALLETSIPLLLKEIRVAVIVGDISTTRDAERIAVTGVPAVQITTESFGGSCHLEASTVMQALDRAEVEDHDLLFVENVGNLVCPAEFDIGHNARVVMISVVDGEDKPLKYPLAFRTSDLVLINKIDLNPYQHPDLSALHGNVRSVNPTAPIIELSARTGAGMDQWVSWVHDVMSRNRLSTSV